MSLGARSNDLEVGPSADILSRRRASASVEEIRNLYSALQELVPVHSRAKSPTPKINQPISGVEKATESAVEKNEPQEGANSNVLEIPKENCLQVQQPRKRLLPTPPGSPRPWNKFDRKSTNDLRQSPGPARRPLENDVKLEVPKKESLRSPVSFLRRRSTGNCLAPHRNENTSEGLSLDETSKKAGRLSPFAKRKLWSPFSRRRGSTPNLIIVNAAEDSPSPPSTPKQSSENPVLLPTSARSPSASRRSSLADTINMLAQTDNIKEFLKVKGKKDTVRENDSRENERAPSDKPKKTLAMLEGQMELLLESLSELQDVAGGADYGVTPSDSELIQKLEERRGSLGGEMQELLGALKELSDTNSIGDPTSRRGSLQESAPVKRESLDSLEAYFHEKLRDATKEKTPSIASECSMRDEQKCSDVTDGANAGQADLAITTEGDKQIGTVRQSKSVEHREPRVHQTEAQLKREQWKKEQQEFALHVNGKLEEWLTRATALSAKDKNDANSTDDPRDLKEMAEKSSRRKLFSKKSFKRQRDKIEQVYRTRRSKSLHDVFTDSDFVGDKDERQEKQVEQVQQILVVSSVTRSKSMHDVTIKKRRHRRTASDGISSSKVGAEVESKNVPQGTVTSQTERHNRNLRIQRSPLVTSSSKEARKARLLPKDPALIKKLSDKQIALAKRQVSENGCLGHFQRKRSGRFPADLPLFYDPKAESAMLTESGSQQEQKPANESKLGSRTPNIKKSLFPQASNSGKIDVLCGEKQGPFYVNNNPEPASGAPRLMTSHTSHILVSADTGGSQNSSCDVKAMQFFYRENSRETQILQRVASHDSLPDYNDDYRDGARSESDDSGCPGNEFNGNEIAVQTDTLLQFGERHRVQENNDRPGEF